MSYHSKYKNAIDQVNAQFNEWSDKALSTGGSKQEDAEKEQRLRAEGFVSYITPQKEEVWIPAPKAPTSAIQDYQKGFSSMSPETLLETYPCLKYVRDNFFPVIDELHENVNNGSISLQAVQEAIVKMIIEGSKEAVEKTGGMSAQGNSPVAKAGSNAEALAIYAKSPSAVQSLMSGGDE